MAVRGGNSVLRYKDVNNSRLGRVLIPFFVN